VAPMKGDLVELFLFQNEEDGSKKNFEARI
jgi:hypothetical protein